MGINQLNPAWLRAEFGSKYFNCSMSLLSTWLNRLEKISASSLSLPVGPQWSLCLFKEHGVHASPPASALTFPLLSAALHTAAFNSLTISASTQTSPFISLGFPISGGLIINLLQELHVRCLHGHEGREAGQLHQMLQLRQLNSNKQIWVSFTKTFPPAASDTQLYLRACPGRKQVLFY